MGKDHRICKVLSGIKTDGPSCLHDERETISEAASRSGKIGIVPIGVIPIYSHSWFSEEVVIDFMNLDYDDRDRLGQYCVWQDIGEVKLKT